MKKQLDYTVSSLALVFALASACDSGFENKPAATVQSQTAAVAAQTAAKDDAPVRTLGLVAEKSEVGFTGAKITGKHTGKFRSVTGEAKVAGNTPKQVNFTVQMSSLESDDEKLTGHLTSPDFFDVEKFPTSRFESTSIAEKVAGDSTHEITGSLTLHGVTKTITFPAKVSVGDDNVTGKAEFTINRKDFGIVYPGKPDDLIKDDVLLSLSLVFPKP